MNSIFTWLDHNINTKKGKFLNQIMPVGISFGLFILAVITSKFYISGLINPNLHEKIILQPRFIDVLVGFFLYFVTAIDYALVVGRMLISNKGSKARLIMNCFTIIGGYVGVICVLFLWGFSKEITYLVIPIMIFAGSVMIKLASEGLDYFENSKYIPKIVIKFTINLVNLLHYMTRIFTFWIPEIARPKTEPLKPSKLAKWSFILPFIIGLDDMIGYMGAMNIYNVYGLLVGIFFADIFIDIIIFVSPDLTKKMVQSSILSFIATYAFLYLGFKSFVEVFHLTKEHFYLSNTNILIDISIFLIGVLLIDLITAKLQKRKSYIHHIVRGSLKS